MTPRKEQNCKTFPLAIRLRSYPISAGIFSDRRCGLLFCLLWLADSRVHESINCNTEAPSNQLRPCMLMSSRASVSIFHLHFEKTSFELTLRGFGRPSGCQLAPPSHFRGLLIRAEAEHRVRRLSILIVRQLNEGEERKTVI